MLSGSAEGVVLLGGAWRAGADIVDPLLEPVGVGVLVCVQSRVKAEFFELRNSDSVDPGLAVGVSADARGAASVTARTLFTRVVSDDERTRVNSVQLPVAIAVYPARAVAAVFQQTTRV